MEIEINDQKCQVEASITVAQVLSESINTELAGMAIAINDRIIPRAKWNEVNLNEGDKMLVIKASKGG